MRIYIGHDPRFERAFNVARRSAERFGHSVIPLYEDRLRDSGMLTRPTDRRGNSIWDFGSNAAQSTEFAISRFFVPLLAHSGWVLFADSDVVFVDDPLRAFGNAVTDICDAKAVYVVKHGAFKTGTETARSANGETYIAPGTLKMDGQVQSVYVRKLWSSVMLWNCNHPANRRLNLITLNQWPGRDLHAFRWLHDEEIGDLPPEANWLVGMQEKPARPIVAHYTLGTPDLPGFEHSQHADLWLAEEARC